MRLAEKVALITGVASGVGKATAQLVALVLARGAAADGGPHIMGVGGVILGGLRWKH